MVHNCAALQDIVLQHLSLSCLHPATMTKSTRYYLRHRRAHLCNKGVSHDFGTCARTFPSTTEPYLLLESVQSHEKWKLWMSLMCSSGMLVDYIPSQLLFLCLMDTLIASVDRKYKWARESSAPKLHCLTLIAAESIIEMVNRRKDGWMQMNLLLNFQGDNMHSCSQWGM